MRISVEALTQIAQNKKLSLEEKGFILHLVTMPMSGKNGSLGIHGIGCLAKNTDLMLKTFKDFLEKGYIKVGKRRHFLTQKFYDECDGVFYNEEKTNNKKTLFLYLMYDSATGLYKIGKSFNPNTREKTLGGQTPLISLIHTTKHKTPKMEKELHEKYKNKRVRGEWFELTQEDVEFIKSL